MVAEEAIIVELEDTERRDRREDEEGCVASFEAYPFSSLV